MSITTLRQDAVPSEAVIEKVADREGVDPLELTSPLYEVVDPDALDALLGTASDRRDGRPLEVTFSYHGYRVSVSSDGFVDLVEKE